MHYPTTMSFDARLVPFLILEILLDPMFSPKIKIRSLPIPLMKKREVKRISIFRYGYEELLHDFWANVKNSAALPT